MSILLTGRPTPLPAPLAADFRRIDVALAGAKSKLDPFEKDSRFPLITRALDLYVGLKRHIAHRMKGQAVTNAWLKMYEMLSQQGLLDACRPPPIDGRAPFRVFCNAELPGAFVSAINHYARSWANIDELRWVASSLFPGKEKGVFEDAYGLYRHNPAQWLMDAEMPGDVSDAICVVELARRAKERLGEVDLYTSDVGIDVSGDFNRQEELTARLNFGQILAGLLSLRDGGGLVVKTYTFTQPFSLSLICACAALFETFNVVKPKTSRPINSEVYLIGIGFRGLTDAAAAHLLYAFRNFDFGRPLIPLGGLGIQDTLLSLLTAAKEIHLKQQVAFLTKVVELFEKYKNHNQRLRVMFKPETKKAQTEWINANPVIHLRPAWKLATDHPTQITPFPRR